MHTSLILLSLALTPLAVHAAGIEEIRVSDGDESIILRADGTAERAYRGRFNDGVRDERVGIFHAKLEARDFRQLAAMPGATGWDELKDTYVPFPVHIVSMTLVRDGRTNSIQRQERRTPSDGEPPIELWRLEMVTRGIATQLRWEPIASGVRVQLGDQRELR